MSTYYAQNSPGFQTPGDPHHAEPFEVLFRELTGHDPFPWQWGLYRQFLTGSIPTHCDIPTGLGKTAVVRGVASACGRPLYEDL